jgi:hypothetical protein
MGRLNKLLLKEVRAFLPVAFEFAEYVTIPHRLLQLQIPHHSNFPRLPLGNSAAYKSFFDVNTDCLLLPRL